MRLTFPKFFADSFNSRMFITNLASNKVNNVFVLKEVQPEMELFLDNHFRYEKSLNVISKYMTNIIFN